MTVMVGFTRETESPVSLCQGVMLQAMPGCDLARFDRMRSRLGSGECRGLLSSAPEVDNHFELILRALCGGDEAPADFSVHLCPVPGFRCRCTRERMLEVVSALPANEIEEALAEDGALRVTCQFCSECHELSADDVRGASQSDASDGISL
jgi:molecular chaperone Hsp33